MPATPAIPRELIEAFARDRGIIFVGAGLSRGAGLPNWDELVAPLASEIQDCPAASYMQLAQFYDNEHGRNLLVKRLRERLAGYSAAPTEAHKALAELPAQRIFTTNFDSLIEEVFKDRERSFDLVVRDIDTSLMQHDLQVVKVHGDLQDAETIVIATEDYDNYLSSKPSIADMLKVDLQTKSALFLGYSFSDEDLRRILMQITRQTRNFRLNLFTVQFDPLPVFVKELRRQGLIVIPLEASGRGRDMTSALRDWLHTFAEKVQAARRAPRPPGTATEPPEVRKHTLPEISEDLIGRREDTERTLEGLRSQYPLICIEGFAGVGKTRLAVEVGYACLRGRTDTGLPAGFTRDRRGAALFEYVIWLSAKDKPDQKLWLNEVLNAIATTTAFSVIAQTEDLVRKATEVGPLLKQYRVLIIIDNFETIEDAALMSWMEKIPSPSKVLLTTREKHLSQTAWPVPLGGLREADGLTLLRQHGAHLGLSYIEQAKDEALLPLFAVTAGNPHAMKLALGLIAESGEIGLRRVVRQLQDASPSQSMDVVFDELFATSWKALSESARCILLVTPLFVGLSSIRRDALQAVSGLAGEPGSFEEGLKQCERFGLLQAEPPSARVLTSEPPQARYAIHSMTRAFARRKLDERPPAFKRDARMRFVHFFLELVRAAVGREAPDSRYWNALVSDGMRAVDPEWPSVEQAMVFADEDKDQQKLLELVMLLVHYMDSRFLNQERLKYVRKAIDVAKELGLREDEALLRMDALGWTFVEEGNLEAAFGEISKGFRIAETTKGEERDNLRALGLAWQARVRLEQDRSEEAAPLIQKALAIPSKPWIKCRVYMAAGDIALKSGDSKQALKYYKQQSEEAQQYGDEGRGYQWRPRIGMAQLDQGQLDEAEDTFESLQKVQEIEIGRLYADYGLAMVAFKRGEVLGARAMINDIRKRLERRTTSNLLVTLIERLYDQLEGRQVA
jgi:tetratricopeptide (TPR) repeat protein